ncbi:CPBP family intramembrane glutamic endopeptidase [Nesterenkonia ebinurensis]|uniref:CPBP family intramembrane glutamic endopeptidase n=1 Tax=Nesterenkonia ebinurensis TaxID=2608252 RepID=UPI001CC71E1E|nr:CPBP family intramembrane glutamic endopeptidase [Nesterenkonia ebinurensis]
MTSTTPPSHHPARPGVDSSMASRRFYAWEVGIVLALSLGRSAVYAVLQLAERLSIAPLSEQSATVQRSRSRAEFFDFSYQLLDSLFALTPVALVIYLVFLGAGNPFRSWGLDFRRPGKDWVLGTGLFAVLGLGTLAVYFAGRSLGLTVQIIPADVAEYWWSTPVLLFAALRHSLLEEIIMVAYLFDRARRIWPQLNGATAGLWILILASAALRAAYHLYQGFGPGFGNLVMGVIFGWLYLKYGRVMPLVIAHFLLDAVAFLAFPLVLTTFGLDSL